MATAPLDLASCWAWSTKCSKSGFNYCHHHLTRGDSFSSLWCSIFLEPFLLTFLQHLGSSQGLVQGHPSPDHSHLVIFALQNHLGMTEGETQPVSHRDWGRGGALTAGSGSRGGSTCSVGSHCSMNTDLGLSNLEILIVVVDNGIFWAAGPDEANALRS